MPTRRSAASTSSTALTLTKPSRWLRSILPPPSASLSFGPLRTTERPDAQASLCNAGAVQECCARGDRCLVYRSRSHDHRALHPGTGWQVTVQGWDQADRTTVLGSPGGATRKCRNAEGKSFCRVQGCRPRQRPPRPLLRGGASPWHTFEFRTAIPSRSGLASKFCSLPRGRLSCLRSGWRRLAAVGDVEERVERVPLRRCK